MRFLPASRVSNRLALCTGLFVAAWGLLVIVGWHVQYMTVTQVYEDWDPMPYDTALGLFLCGTGLAGASMGSWRVAFGCSLLAGVLAALTLVEHLFGVDLRITELMVPVTSQGATYTGHMSPNAAGALFLCGLMLVTVGYGLRQKVEGYAFANMMGLLVALFGLLSLMTFFSTMGLESGWGKLTVMTPQAALGFTLLGLSAAIFRWPEDAEESVDITHLQNVVITYVCAGVLITVLFSAAIGLLPVYDLLQSDPHYEAAPAVTDNAGTHSLLSSHEHLGNALRRQAALTGIAALFLAYIGGFGVWRLLRPLTGRIVMRAGALEKAVHKATEELEVSVKDLERSNRQLDQFARVVSHDLRSPLNSIAGFAQLIDNRYGPALGQEGKEFLGFISEGARKMQAQISGLLELSRLQSPAQPAMPVQTGEVMSQLLSYLQADIQQAGAKLYFQDLPTVQGDRTQIALLFQNLIANAIKFHRPGITPEVTISAHREGSFWRFSVQDNGIGIAPANREAVFEIFRRLHTRDEYPGTGIGLALCKEIVERHGGVIAVESQPDAGCVFTFTLPAVPADTGA